MSKLSAEQERVDNDRRRERLVQEAVQAADHIIMDGADGSVEDLNYLTTKVAQAFVNKTVMGALMAINKKVLMDTINDKLGGEAERHDGIVEAISDSALRRNQK